MTDITIYLLGLLITILISLLVVFYFKSHFKKILLELNGEKERPANFWAAYTNIILILGPLICAMMIYPDMSKENIFFEITQQIMWALIGLVISLVVIGIIVIKFLPKDS